MTGEQDQGIETLEVPQPYSCTLAELREVHEVFHVDLIPEFEAKGMTSIEVLEPVAYLGYRRKGLLRAKARRAAGDLTAVQLVPEDIPDLGATADETKASGAGEESAPPNPESSAT